eukprot:TRINITY_DN5775_c0_g1_i4.p1 TRINITY_DN5775_c0_g1~~TRINITY_DN5775_c0_g1_i4.p1  ORF type:complete len:168 (+),score=19.24 TRINITY_DN5775_c0_g1_i4:447-950(+)
MSEKLLKKSKKIKKEIPPPPPKNIKSEVKDKEPLKNINAQVDTSNIDEIFSKLKSKPKAMDKGRSNQESKRKKFKFNNRDSKGDSRKFTEEGYKIYSLEELNIGKGGGTSLCPFDCDCCFQTMHLTIVYAPSWRMVLEKREVNDPSRMWLDELQESKRQQYKAEDTL